MTSCERQQILACVHKLPFLRKTKLTTRILCCVGHTKLQKATTLCTCCTLHISDDSNCILLRLLEESPYVDRDDIFFGEFQRNNWSFIFNFKENGKIIYFLAINMIIDILFIHSIPHKMQLLYLSPQTCSAAKLNYSSNIITKCWHKQKDYRRLFFTSECPKWAKRTGLLELSDLCGWCLMYYAHHLVDRFTGGQSKQWKRRHDGYQTSPFKCTSDLRAMLACLLLANIGSKSALSGWRWCVYMVFSWHSFVSLRLIAIRIL